MYSILPAALAAIAAFASVGNAAGCTSQEKIAGVKKEIQTIRSHAVSDGLAIPYAPAVYRVFTIIANETKPISLVVPAGVDALSTRAVLVVLGAILEADVPKGSDHYTVNPNGTITVDYIQTDGIALQKVDVREIHSFNDDCQITGITGYIRGNIEAFLGNVNVPKLLDQITPGVPLGTLVARLLGTL